MMIPEFIRFYNGYTVSTVLNEYARRFMSMLNAMYRLKADESLINITEVASGISGKEASGVITELTKQSSGIHGIISEAKILDKVRGKK